MNPSKAIKHTKITWHEPWIPEYVRQRTVFRPGMAPVKLFRLVETIHILGKSHGKMGEQVQPHVRNASKMLGLSKESLPGLSQDFCHAPSVRRCQRSYGGFLWRWDLPDPVPPVAAGHRYLEMSWLKQIIYFRKEGHDCPLNMTG